MDRQTQQFSRGFQGSYGNFRFLEMMDIISPELSEKDIKNARTIMGHANTLFASIAYNSKERRFTLWAAEMAREQLIAKVEGRTWDREEAKTITLNFISTKRKLLLTGKTFRPKGFRGEEWHLHNTQRKNDNE